MKIPCAAFRSLVVHEVMSSDIELMLMAGPKKIFVVEKINHYNSIMKNIAYDNDTKSTAP